MILALLACRPEKAAGDDAPTWHGDVAPLLAAECVSCHQEGQIAPFALDSYEDAAALADAIAASTADRTMPPWGVDGGGDCQTWAADRWLSDEEIATLRAWADAGAPPGEPAAAPEPPEVEALEDPLTLSIPAGYTPADEPDEHRCFLLDPGLDADAFLTAYALEPGAPEIVHHAILYTLDDADAEAQAETLDAADDAPGYPCFGSALAAPSRPVAAWAPGTPPTAFPQGSGLRLLAGRKLILQIHYYTGAGTTEDQTRLHLQLAGSVSREALAYLLADTSMRLPPGEAAAEASWDLSLAALGLPLGVFVQGVFPHMHQRGRTLTLEAHREGQDRCMADVQDWDFAWQQLYFYEQPVYLYPDDTLRLTCTFDTSADEEEVAWGESTEDEMCLVGLVVTLF